MPTPTNGNESTYNLREDMPDIINSATNPKLSLGELDPSTCEQEGSQTSFVSSDNSTLGATSPSSELLLRFDWQDLSSVCPGGLDVRLVDTLLFKVVANHWLTADTIVNPVLRQYLYTDDPQTTGIRIVMNTKFDKAGSSRLPAIILKRGTSQFKTLTMGDQNEGTETEFKYVRMVEGTHQFLCVSSNDGETEALALELYEYINCISPLLQQQIPFHRFQLVQVGEVGIMEELGNQFAVPVVVQYQYEMGWTLSEVAPLMSGFRVNATSSP